MKALKECHNDVIEIFGYGVQVIGALFTWHDLLRKRISSGKTKKSNQMFFGNRATRIVQRQSISIEENSATYWTRRSTTDRSQLFTDGV